jgi:hypothetical protein
MTFADTPSSSSPTRGLRHHGTCPFHDGVATLDAFLAELDPRDTTLFDAALDLRLLAIADAGDCVAQLFRVRSLVGDRHYLAFYRVRCWARRALRIDVRAHRNARWESCPFPLDGARLDEVVNGALASLATAGAVPAAGQVRFAFAAR